MKDFDKEASSWMHKGCAISNRSNLTRHKMLKNNNNNQSFLVALKVHDKSTRLIIAPIALLKTVASRGK